MLCYETVDCGTLALLKQIQLNPLFAETRLVGGTALALQIGHRKSIDLDLFGTIALDPIDLHQELQTYGTLSVRGSSKNIHRFLLNGVQLDIVNYNYHWLEDPIRDDGIQIASCRDIAAMKLAAIANRGTKKDFMDLAFLLEQFSLSKLLELYTQKFPEGSAFIVMKSLVYFDDADEDPMPYMLKQIDWGSAKERIKKAVSPLARA